MERLEFLELVASNYNLLVSRCKHRKVRLAEAGDFIHKAIASVLEKKSYESINTRKGNPVGWLVTTVKRRMFEALRRQKFEEDLFCSLDEVTGTPDEQGELRLELRAALSQLSPLQRFVLERVHIGNESYASLSVLLGRPYNEIREIGREARRILRESLGA